MELEEGMAWHQRHFIEFPDVPCGDNDSSAVGIGLNAVNGILNLVDHTSFLGLPLTPLLPIHRS